MLEQLKEVEEALQRILVESNSQGLSTPVWCKSFREPRETLVIDSVAGEIKLLEGYVAHDSILDLPDVSDLIL
jgi:hypothetical protein